MIKGKLVKTTPPAAEPLTLEEVKHHLRVDGTEEDMRIEELIQAAREYCEEITGRALIRQGFQFYPEFVQQRKIYLPRAPLIEVDSVTFFFEDESTQVVDPAAYLVDTADQPGSILLKKDYDWPEEVTLELREINPVMITYSSGYGDDGSAVPRRIRQAMYLLIGHWWENREDSITAVVIANIPLGVSALLQMERLF